MHTDIYIERGYATRNEYLEKLAEEYGRFGVSEKTVFKLADRLGDGEDFGKLIEILDELSDGNVMKKRK